VKRCPNPQGEAPVKIEITMTKRVLAAELGTVNIFAHARQIPPAKTARRQR
jgi:hypothetical protein